MRSGVGARRRAWHRVAVLVALACLLAACGRIAFDPRADGDAATNDAMQLTDCQVHAAAIFCDGFEAQLSAWPMIDGAPTATTSPVHSGTGAVRAAIAARPEVADTEVVLPIATVSALYTRSWIYVPSGFSVDHLNLVNLIAPDGTGVSLIVMAEALRVYYDTPAQGYVGAAPLERDRWQCYELVLNVADAGGSIELRINDQSVASGANLDTRPPAGFNSLAVGIPFSGTAQTGPATVYIDDVVVDATPIGCGP